MRKEKIRFDLRQEAYKKMELLHPHQVMLYVSMVGSAIVFLFMIVAFAASRPESTELIAARFPKSFVISTIVILLSSFSVSKVVPAFESDDLDELKKWMGITFLLGLIFSMSQLTGWKELEQNGISFSGDRSRTYLYVISGLHVMHMAGIMIFLLAMLMQCHKVSKDVVRHLVYATNPYQKIKLKMLRDFWHFVDVLWLVLFLYFLFTF
jgi:cytochrome c oxidase subunit 3